MRTLSICIAIVRRDVLLGWRSGAGVATAIGLYGLIVVLVPFGLGPDGDLLSNVAPGILWIALSLALLLTLDRLFQIDLEDGSLDLLFHSPAELELIVLAKSLAHWLIALVPLLLVTPVLSLFLNMSIDRTLATMTSLTLGSPTLVFIGAIGAALSVAIKRGGIIIGLLVLPLYVPVIIFGVGAAQAGTNVFFAGAEGPQASLLFLSALSLFSVVLGPIAGAAALRSVRS